MKLSLKLIARRISRGNVRIAARRRSEPDQMRLECIMLWDRELVWPEENVLYVADGSQLRRDFRCPQGIAMMVLGRVEEELFAGADADVMIWEMGRREMNFREQFNQVSTIFREYQDLELRIQDRLINAAPLMELVMLGERLFGNPILLLDEGYSLLLKPRGPNPLDWELGKYPQAPALAAETVELIRMSPEFRSRDRHNGLFYLSSDTLDCGVLFLHVQREGMTFFIAVLEMEQPIREADHQLLLAFSQHMYVALRSRRFSRANALYFQQFLEKLLTNEKIELPEINRQLHSQHWNITDPYVCFVAEPDLWNRKDVESYSLCRMIENRFQGSYAFYHDERVVCIVNLDQAGMERDVFLQLLSQYIRDQLLRVGVSYGFRDFVSLHNYYQQALAALDIGKQRTPDEWNYRFEKYVLEYFIRYGTSRMEGRYLCHPDLIALFQYDQENNTELLQTLKIYLACGQNATTTATELFIHRNTLYQRLSKIDSLIDANLNNPETRLYLQISYSIVDFNAI